MTFRCLILPAGRARGGSTSSGPAAFCISIFFFFVSLIFLTQPCLPKRPYSFHRFLLYRPPTSLLRPCHPSHALFVWCSADCHQQRTPAKEVEEEEEEEEDTLTERLLYIYIFPHILLVLLLLLLHVAFIKRKAKGERAERSAVVVVLSCVSSKEEGLACNG